MSYYATMSFGGEIRTNLVDDFADAIKEIKAKREKIIRKDENSVELEFVEYFFAVSPFKIVFSERSDTFYLETDEWHTQHFGDECFDDEFVRFIAPFMQPQDIEFLGEDGGYWGYRIKENNKVVRLEQEIVEGVEL